MATSALTMNRSRSTSDAMLWLRSQRWDLTFITLSVILVPIPYLMWLGLNQLGINEDITRNIINGVVALAVGGPHMYCTFTRTLIDKDFVTKKPAFARSTVVIPLVVITLALLNLELLLTVFFFWASLHVLHQIVFVVEAYDKKKKTDLSLPSRAIEYAVVLTSLYPIAAYKIVNNDFKIGQNDIAGVIPEFFRQPIFFWLALFVFVTAFIVFTIKSIREYRAGILHGPKTAFIYITAITSFIVPSLGNLDTAFQGMNAWHSFQYLALTWYINRIREEKGEMHALPIVERISRPGAARSYSLLMVGFTVGTVALAAVIFAVLYFLAAPASAATAMQKFNYAFDRSYYIAVLSFLWMHYYHDHFLFTHPEAVTNPPAAAIAA